MVGPLLGSSNSVGHHDSQGGNMNRGGSTRNGDHLLVAWNGALVGAGHNGHNTSLLRSCLLKQFLKAGMIVVLGNNKGSVGRMGRPLMILMEVEDHDGESPRTGSCRLIAGVTNVDCIPLGVLDWSLVPVLKMG